MLHGVLNIRKNQSGFDGYLTFNLQKKKETVLIEVKSGKATLPQVNQFIKSVNEMNAGIGLFVCFKEEVTSGMLQSAKREGYYKKEIFGNKIDKIQIITVDDLLDYKDPNLPYIEHLKSYLL